MPESRGDSARPWRRPDVCSPSRWAQGVCGRRIAQANPCRTWGWYRGCEGENPGIPLRKSDRANGRPAKGNQRRTKTPHRAASGCGGQERSKRP